MNQQIFDDYKNKEVKDVTDKVLLMYTLALLGLDKTKIRELGLAADRYFDGYYTLALSYVGTTLETNNQQLETSNQQLETSNPKVILPNDKLKASNKEQDVKLCIITYITDDDIKVALKEWYESILASARKRNQLPTWFSISANIDRLYRKCSNDRDRVRNAIVYSREKQWLTIDEEPVLVPVKQTYNNTYTSNNKQYAESNAKPAYNNERNTYDDKQPTKGWYPDTPGSVPIDPNRSELQF